MKDPHNLQPLVERLDLEFRDQRLLRIALTHRSYLNENPHWALPHNERLEFLGDQVLGLVVKDFLFDEYPRFSEGEMTMVFNRLINNEFLAEVSFEIRLPDFVLLSVGEARNVSGATMRAARVLEAFLGAVYKDQGLGATRLLVDHMILRRLRDILRQGLPSLRDPKTHLQELSQAVWGVTPTYEAWRLNGPDHRPQYEARVFAGNRVLASGFGSSTKRAQVAAAEAAIAQHFQQGEK